MAIKPLKNDFTAYMTLCEKQFLVTVKGNLCKFFAREDRDDLRIFYGEPIKRHIIYGFDEDQHKIAFPMSLSVAVPEHFFHFVTLYHPFKTPYIIKGNRSSDESDKLETFDAINFTGKVVDSLYPPGIQAVDIDGLWEFPENGARAIKTRPYDEYTYRYPFELYGDTGTLLYAASLDGSDLISGQLGKLSAIIRLALGARRRHRKRRNPGVCKNA